jgi:hypothetical protein
MQTGLVGQGSPSVEEIRDLQKGPDVRQANVVDVAPVEVAEPVVIMEAPQAFTVEIKFGPTTTINENLQAIPRLTEATLPEVTAFLTAHGGKQPEAITRTGDQYILNMGNGVMLKARTGNIEEAVAKGIIKEGSPLLASLKMTELTTSADLPAKAQRKIQALATAAPSTKVPDPFQKAQTSAIFAAYVEKFAKIIPAVDARVSAVYADNDDVQMQWLDFKYCYDKASEDGDYEEAFNALNQFTATIEGLEKGSDSPWLKPQLPDKEALPPSNIITMANLASIKLRTAVTHSGQTITDPKDVSKTIVAPTLTENDKKAIADPRGFLASLGNDWNAARKLYREGKLTHPGAGMQALLDFRKTVVEDILRQVKVETKAHVLGRKEALNADLPQDEQVPVEAKDLGWSAAGSNDATSDVDTSLSGEGTEFAAKRFNELFSAAWGRDSGIVFDVNVYARDFVPQLDKMAFHKTSKSELGDDVQASAEATIKWDTDIRGTGFEGAWDNHQELQALYSTRSHMSKPEWITFKRQQLAATDALPNTAPQMARTTEKNRLNALFGQVEQKFRDHNDAVCQVALKSLNADLVSQGKLPFLKMPHYDNEMPHATQHALEATYAKAKAPDARGKAETTALAAENTIYHQCLDGNAGVREKRLVADTRLTSLKGKLAKATEELEAARLTGNPTTIKAAEGKVATLTGQVAEQTKVVHRLTFDLKVAISESLNYANETYATEAALLHTVGNKQMLSKGPYADQGSKPRLGKIKLSERQWTQAFREQIGMSFKELTRRDNMGDSLIQGGKYVHRALNAAKHIQKMTGMPIAGPPSLDFLRFLAKETVGTKKDGKVIDSDKGDTAINNLRTWVLANPDQGLTLEDVSDQTKMRDVLMRFAGEVENTYQKWVAAGRPKPDKGSVEIVVNPSIKIPTTSYRATKKRADVTQQIAITLDVSQRFKTPDVKPQAQQVTIVSAHSPSVALVSHGQTKTATVTVVVPKQKVSSITAVLTSPEVVKARAQIKLEERIDVLSVAIHSRMDRVKKKEALTGPTPATAELRKEVGKLQVELGKAQEDLQHLKES